MPHFFFSPPPLSPINALQLAGTWLNDYAHIVDHRIALPTPPPWMPTPVSEWLLSLSDHQLEQCESKGFSNFVNSSISAPSSIKQLSHRASIINSHFPLLPPEATQFNINKTAKKRLRPTKHAQIQRLSLLAEHIIASSSKPVQRVVDVGAGHAHLASHLAEQLAHLHIPVMAIDRDEQLIATARSLHNVPHLSFTTSRVRNTIQTQLGDLLVGLHACGSLGDIIVQTAATKNVSAVLLVSCCLQKLQSPLEIRNPLSKTARDDKILHKALNIPKNRLGITNRSRGYASEKDIRSRETRYALRQLLNSHGLPVERMGDEVVGISRHRLHKGLAEVVYDAFALRGFQNFSISSAELQRCADDARVAYRKMRALTLPRALAGEVLEMAIVLDRAALLEESDQFRSVLTCRLWNDSLSVRNLCCAAWQ